MSVKQAPEELLKKYTEMGFKKMWINKEFQRFCSTVSPCLSLFDINHMILLVQMIWSISHPITQKIISFGFSSKEELQMEQFQFHFSWKRVVQMKLNQKYFHFCLMPMVMEKSVLRKFCNQPVLWKPTVSF